MPYRTRQSSMRQPSVVALAQLRNTPRENQSLRDLNCELRADLLRAQARIRQLETRAEGREKYINRLKQAISAAKVSSDYATDDELSRDFQGLLHQIQDWAMITMRGFRDEPALRLLSGSAYQWLEIHMPFLSSQRQNRKYEMYALACLVSRTLITSLSEVSTFGSAPETFGEAFTKVENNLYHRERHTEFHQWLHITRSLLDAAEPDFLARVLEQRVHQMSIELADTLRGATNIPVNDETMSKLDIFVRAAVTFFNKICFHPARYIFASRQNTTPYDAHRRLSYFDPDVQEDIDPLRERYHADARVVGFIWPGLYKIRNESGDRINAIPLVKAKVWVD